MGSSFVYGAIHINEDFYEQAIIEHLRDELGYECLNGADVPRTSDKYERGGRRAGRSCGA